MTIFPKRIAQNDPNAATYHGVKGERVHSNNKAVTKAEPSKKLRLLFKKIIEQIISVLRAKTTTVLNRNRKVLPFHKWNTLK